MMVMKIDGEERTLKKHYQSPYQVTYAILEDYKDKDTVFTVHSFPSNIDLSEGKRFKTNGHEYEVVKGPDYFEKCISEYEIEQLLIEITKEHENTELSADPYQLGYNTGVRVACRTFMKKIGKIKNPS